MYGEELQPTPTKENKRSIEAARVEQENRGFFSLRFKANTLRNRVLVDSVKLVKLVKSAVTGGKGGSGGAHPGEAVG